VHIDFIGDVNVLGNVAPYYDQYVNPIDYFTGKPASYDIPEIQEIPFLPGSNGLGILNYYTELGDPSNIAYGVVSFLARPVSAFIGVPTDASEVGVRYLRHRVLKQDPYT
jgi:hypothetical protein